MYKDLYTFCTIKKKVYVHFLYNWVEQLLVAYFCVFALM